MFFGAGLGYGQQVRPEVQRLASQIEKHGQIESAHIGYAGRTSEQFERCEKLFSLATEQELKTLTDHKSPIVRCVAFAGLSERNPELAFTALENRLHDTEEFSVQSGCLGYTITVADDCLRTFRSIMESDSFKLEQRQPYLKKIDDLVLRDLGMKSEYKRQLLLSLEPLQERYSIVRRNAASSLTPEALVALAKYMNPEDIALILAGLRNPAAQNFALRAVQEFPDPQFFGPLTEIFRTNWNDTKFENWRVLYKALAKYPEKKETLELFELTFSIESKWKPTFEAYLLMAIKKFPHENFASLETRITNAVTDSGFFYEEMDMD